MNRINFPISLPVIIAFFLLASLILGVVFLWPKYKEVKLLEKDITAKETELQQEDQYFSSLKKLKEELKQYQETLSKIDSALPNNPSLPSFLNFIQKESSQSGLILKDMSPFTSSLSGENPEIKETRMSLTLEGSYSSFKDFLSLLEKSARIIEVENISFSSSEKDSPFVFNLKIKFHSY